MTSFKALSTLALMAFATSGCVVAVGSGGWDDDDDYRHSGDGDYKVDISRGRTVEFACPSGYEAFTRADAESGASEYGCRRIDG